MTTDMRAVIIPKSDQLNADDLIAGPRTITIRKVEIRPGSEQPVSIYFDGDNNKPWKTCKSMNRVLVNLWGPDANNYIGRSLTIYRDPNVKWAGMPVGGIRISHMSHLDGKQTMALTETKGSRKAFSVLPLQVDKKPEQTKEQSAPAISDETKAAGEKVAGEGVKAYQDWLAGLSPEVKETVRPFHKEWSSRAKKADASKTAAEAITYTPIIGQPMPCDDAQHFTDAMLDGIKRTDEFDISALMKANMGQIERLGADQIATVKQAAADKGWVA